LVVNAPVKKNSILFFFIFLNHWIGAQENCIFNYYNKKGSYYLFSTFFEPDMRTPLDGECTSYANGKIYEKRVFKNGRLLEEELYHFNGPLREKYTTKTGILDSVKSILELYDENGYMTQKSIFYLDKSNDRCQKLTYYRGKQKIHSVQYNTWLKITDVEPQYELKNHPPHTVDDDGYTYLQIPFGTYIEYHDNGKLKLSYEQRREYNTYDSDYSKHGKFLQYHDNGTIQIDGQYKDGKKDGDWFYYNYNGAIIKEEHYQNNMYYGVWKGFFDDGSKQFELVYDTSSNNPFSPSSKYWNQKGQLIKEVTLDKSGKGTRKEWSDDGIQLVYCDIINNSELNGIEKRWFANGQLKEYFNHYKNADTSYASYFENGKPERLKTFNSIDNHTIIEDQTWNTASILINYTKSIQDDEGTDFIYVTRNDSGNVQREIDQKKDLRTEKYYYTSGVLKQLISFKDYKLDGLYQWYDSLGNLRTSLHFKDGIRNGKCQYFDSLGQETYYKTFNEGCIDTLEVQKDSSKNRKLEDLNTLEREKFENYVRAMLYRTYSNNANDLVFRKTYIDTLTQYLVWYHDYCEKESNGLIAFEFPEKINYEPTFILPKHTFWGIDKNDTTNPYVVQLLAVFKKINWNSPIEWQDKNDHFEGVYRDDNFYANGFYNLNFMWYLQSAFLKFDEVKRDINLNYYQYENNYFNLKRLENCTFQMSYIYRHRSYDWVIYEDGSCDFLPITKTWEEVEKEMNEPENPKMYWD
jgi:antitoxin component YwqK of YwqJK toxin-antitoxin module